VRRTADPGSGRSRARLKLGAVLTVLLVGTLLAACGSSNPGKPKVSLGISRTTTTSSHGPSTLQVFYDPYSPGGAVLPTLRVTTTVSGSCQASGVAGNSSFRCFAGNAIYDPCFAPRGATSGPLLCPLNPVKPDMVRLDTGALPTPLSGAPADRPWALELSNGQVCMLVNAAWGGLGPFQCPATTPGPLVDCHSPQSGSRWWTAACQDHLSNSSPFAKQRVTTIWS